MADRDGPGSHPEQEPAERRSSVASDVNNAAAATATSRTPDAARRRPQLQQQSSSVAPGQTDTAMSLNIKRTRANYAPQGSASSSLPSRQSIPTPDQSTPKPRKPPIGRRQTSSSRIHRGQEFSVDDAQDEVDGDLLSQHRQAKSSGSLRRVPSTTLRRRPTAQPPSLAKVDSADSDDEAAQQESAAAPTDAETQQPPSSGEDTLRAEEEEEEEEEIVDAGDDDADLSDAESFTLKDRQEAINETHPFGIRIWKPALYKKNRSVQRNAEGDIHSTPGGFVSRWLFLFNILWTLLFGWWLAALAALGALVCFCLGFADGCMDYGKTFWGLSCYIFYPFGKYVKLKQEEEYADEDEGEGRSISEYEQWQSGDIEEGRLFFGPMSNSIVGRRRSSIDSTADESTSLLGRPSRGAAQSPDGTPTKRRRLFGRGKWNVGRVIFFVVFYGLLTPALFLVSITCYLFVFSIPMGKVSMLLFNHLRRHPLALGFHGESVDTRRPGDPASSILLCTYRAVGLKYWKYTIDGTNIFFINLLGVVVFVIVDYYLLWRVMGLEIFLTNQFFIFALSLFSVIPLAYFIGQAVASISAQSSMGVGATINAFFSTIVEVYLYCCALDEGKAQLVEGSIIGSIFAGILFLPGLSMCFGALKRKTQRFNVKSAGVTSTMLLFAMIGSFSPTLFYQIFGSHELNCHSCHRPNDSSERDCRRCYFAQSPAVHDNFYLEAVRPYTWIAATMLFLSYVIGLLFTLRTHAAVIWSSELDEKKIEKMDMAASHLSSSQHLDHHNHRTSVGSRGETPTQYGTLARTDIRDSALYKRILGQSLKQVGLSPSGGELPQKRDGQVSGAQTPHVVPPRDGESQHSIQIHGMSEEENNQLVRQVAEIAATAAAVASRDATKAPRKSSQMATTSAAKFAERPQAQRQATLVEEAAETHQPEAGGHDAPNWGRGKSAFVLLAATVAYAIIAEMLVNTVDAVLENVKIDEKFLGITLFALVPNTTEFLNAISFAMNGNIALSMEIGSAYALQVCLLQVPALVLYSAIKVGYMDPKNIIDHTFTLIFPQWDMVTVILCVFLLSYMYGEGKSNYFKGSILILSYLVVVVGFYFSGFDSMDMMGIDPFDTLAVKGEIETFRTVGRRGSGRAY